MGFFDNLFNGSSDPSRSAQIRGGMLGAARALLQPYSGIGNALTGAGYGAMDAKDQYQQEQFNSLKLEDMKAQRAQRTAQQAALNNLFLGTQSTTPNSPATPTMQAPQQKLPQDTGFGPDYSNQASTVPAIQPQQQFKLPPGFDSPEQFHAYGQAVQAGVPEEVLKRMYPTPPKPEATPDSIQIAQMLFPNDPKAQHDYLMKNSPANLRAITNINTPRQTHNWQILTDTKNHKQYRYDVDTGLSTDLAGKPYTPEGAEKISGGNRPRTAPAMALAKFIEEHPDSNADEVKSFAAGFSRAQSYGRTLGTRTAAADYAAEEANTFALQARAASQAVDRSKWTDYNRLLQSGERRISDPALKKLLIATDALVNARARAISPNGIPHVEDQKVGRDMLSAADGPEAYEAGVQQMILEVQGAKAAGEHLGDTVGDNINSIAPPAKTINPAELPANAKMQLKAGTVTTFKNGSKWTLKDGKPVQVQ